MSGNGLRQRLNENKALSAFANRISSRQCVAHLNRGCLSRPVRFVVPRSFLCPYGAGVRFYAVRRVVGLWARPSLPLSVWRGCTVLRRAPRRGLVGASVAPFRALTKRKRRGTLSPPCVCSVCAVAVRRCHTFALTTLSIRESAAARASASLFAAALRAR